MGSSGAATAITRRPSHGPRPLSFPQERLFLLDQIMPGLPAYNVPTLVRIRRTLDAELLRQACEDVVARHEILRTTITLVDGRPLQEVASHRPFELTVADLRARPRPEADRAAEALLVDLSQRPFNLGADVLLRVALVHVAADEDLVLTVLHHIGSDHVSSRLLFSELDSIYCGRAAGREPELPDLPVQYADFGEWQREQMSGALQQELLDYWTERLHGAPELLELPLDRPRPSAQSYRGAVREFVVPESVVTPLRQQGRRHGVSMFMVLLAAFKALLHRYTGAEDLVVGAPVSGRHHEEIDALLGFFSNTLVLRTDLSGDPTFAELLARVRSTTLEAQIYQELPFEKLVEALNPRRAASYSPIFQVLLGFDVAPASPPTLAGQLVEPLPVPGWEWSRFDLSIVLREAPGGSLKADLEYATDLFDATTIDRLIGHLNTILKAVSAQPELRVSELPLLTDEEALLLREWNETTRSYDRRCIDELFSEQAARTPDAIAVVSGAARITYAELDRGSNQLAHELAALGVRDGTLVGICLERSVDLLVAMLGVLKSGGAYVPIEPTYPPQRQEFMLADADAPVLITQERLLGVIDPRGGKVICIDRDWDEIATHPSAPVARERDPDQLAYVIYTSGSTGQPKGVEIRHSSVANLISYMRQWPGIGRDDILANLTTPAFDLSVPDWYLPLSTGARLVLVPREATLDGVELADWLVRLGATVVQATPTTWQMLVDAGWKGSRSLKLVCGGEALPRGLAGQLLERAGTVWHMYGPTETTVWSSVLRLAPGEGPVPLGGPIANTRFFVVDQRGAPVPIGIPGELLIGGDGVARGYHERASLTAEKFVEATFDRQDSERLYRTGDLVRWRADGTLEFIGRLDQQVKLRGFRIELGEIESVLEGNPAVAAAIALVREDSPGDQRLVAYVVGRPDHVLELDELRRLVKTKLPPFMVPSLFVELDEVPVTPNGKLDRRALPVPGGARPELRRTYVAPSGPIEQALASLWEEVLGVERVGVQDDFFDLGGHSLLAVRMLGRLHDTLGLTVPLASLFESSTIRELAAAASAELLRVADDDEFAAILDEVEGSA